MTREEAYQLARPRFKNKNLFKHVLAVEAVMRGLAVHLQADAEKWGLVGLLHDLDYEATADTPDQHTLVTESLLAPYHLDADIIQAIKCHNNKAECSSLMDLALYSADPVTGLIVAATLMHPNKKLHAIDVPFIMRRFKEKSFARGANREQIELCSRLGLSLEKFLEISIQSMQTISQELGF